MGARVAGRGRKSFDNNMEEGARARPYYSRSSASQGQHARDGEDDIVGLIKSAQRRDKEWATAWAEYCEEFGGGTQDPNRHSTGFLCRALKDLGLPASEGNLERLIQRVKQYQRRSTGDDSLWNLYCSEHGTENVFDPAQYPETFLKKAMQHIQENEVTTVGSSQPASDSLIAEVKTLQKANSIANDAWMEFCELKGRSVLDPSRHTSGFLRSGLKFARKAISLVDAIKQLSRDGQREMWVAYCDDRGDAVYDPALHTSEFLEGAVEHLMGSSEDACSRLQMLQKKNSSLSEEWRSFCDNHGNGIYDPTRHSDQFVRRALRELGY
eukprot:TRINITY_DN6151_c3_g1_i1.p1 TRINITY_DN6151_c3_g1~~TRINITY_DN6151_c3_g1_i1.p1  ORF type:complete len:342 (+),score=67.41 TRINITY_DN6151_c3_g1_i1:52-1026(+)